MARPRSCPCLEDLCEAFIYLFFFALGIINERLIVAGSNLRLKRWTRIVLRVQRITLFLTVQLNTLMSTTINHYHDTFHQGVPVCIYLEYCYFVHRWGTSLFTPPPGSRVRRLGWSQYMHECIGASQGYHGVYRAAQTVLSRCCHVLVTVHAATSRAMCWGFHCTPPAVAAP